MICYKIYIVNDRTSRQDVVTTCEVEEVREKVRGIPNKRWEATSFFGSEARREGKAWRSFRIRSPSCGHAKT